MTQGPRSTASPDRHVLPGTQPPGAADEAAAARHVRKLFSDIAGRYDLLNHLLSLNVDRYWRRAVAREFRHLLARPSARALDLCCGTADLSMALAREGTAPIISCDFSHAMLTLAQQKLNDAPRRLSSLPMLAEADALQLPFEDCSFDLVVCAFGFRNLANYHAGLDEIWRLLRPGGEVGILEFSEPGGRWLAPLYSLYFHRILPAIGEWLTGVGGAYRYLAASVDRFPGSEEFTEWMRSARFEALRARKLTGGIAVLYVGRKPTAS